MAERPILFSAPMVRATLDGSKTQTRRVVKITHQTPGLAACLLPPAGLPTRPGLSAELCPYGRPGDRLWVRERFAAHWMYDDLPPTMARSQRDDLRATDNRWYFADGDEAHSQHGAEPSGLRGKWRPSIHMPRWASRITLEITRVRVERLQDISRTDAQAEGCHHDDPCDHKRRTCDDIGCEGPDYRVGFRNLWESINGPDSWKANPWVWVVDFRRA